MAGNTQHTMTTYVVEFDFDAEWPLIKVRGDDLVFLFDDGGQLVLQDFAKALSGTFVLMPDGILPAFELFQLAELASEDPESLQALADKILKGSGNNTYSDDTGGGLSNRLRLRPGLPHRG